MEKGALKNGVKCLQIASYCVINSKKKSHSFQSEVLPIPYLIYLCTCEKIMVNDRNAQQIPLKKRDKKYYKIRIQLPAKLFTKL